MIEQNALGTLDCQSRGYTPAKNYSSDGFLITWINGSEKIELALYLEIQKTHLYVSHASPFCYVPLKEVERKYRKDFPKIKENFLKKMIKMI